MENKYSAEGWDKYYMQEEIISVKPKVGFFASYDIFLCDSILEKYLPFNKGKKENIKICEIGSGDARLLKKISDNFNYQPFGIEYASEPIPQAKARGVQVIKSDLFDEAMLTQYEEHFDVIYSYGFIEHILPPEKAIEAHLRLLKKGGYLVLQIPRFKKFNWLKARIFRPEILPLHNLEIMEAEVLSSLVDKNQVQELFCRNYGTLKLRIPMSHKNIRHYILKAVCWLEYILNPLFRLAFKDKGFETRMFSPAVIFIGKKK